jgi:hypothetical protein
LNRLRHFHHRCAWTMCRNNVAHKIHHRISSASLFKRLSIESFDNYYNRQLLRWTGHVARMPLTRASIKILTSWVDNPRPLGCPQMNWGRLWKRPFRIITFQPTSSNGARWRLIEINGVLFAVLKCRVQQKRYRHPHDKTSGHNFETAMYHHEYKNLHRNSRWANKMDKRNKESNNKTSRLKILFFYCVVALCTIRNALLMISNLTWLYVRHSNLQ